MSVEFKKHKCLILEENAHARPSNWNERGVWNKVYLQDFFWRKDEKYAFSKIGVTDWEWVERRFDPVILEQMGVEPTSLDEFYIVPYYSIRNKDRAMVEQAEADLLEVSKTWEAKLAVQITGVTEIRHLNFERRKQLRELMKTIRRKWEIAEGRAPSFGDGAKQRITFGMIPQDIRYHDLVIETKAEVYEHAIDEALDYCIKNKCMNPETFKKAFMQLLIEVK